MRGVRAVDRIVDLCQRDLAFIWLTKGQKPQRDVFYDFKGKKLTGEALDELNYQFMRRLEKEGLITLKELSIDGTKIEANANRYTFVWRGSLNYHLVKLLDSIDALYAKYNAFLLENGYGPKYDLGDTHMFDIKAEDARGHYSFECTGIEQSDESKPLLFNGKGSDTPPRSFAPPLGIPPLAF